MNRCAHGPADLPPSRVEELAAAEDGDRPLPIILESREVDVLLPVEGEELINLVR